MSLAVSIINVRVCLAFSRGTPISSRTLSAICSVGSRELLYFVRNSRIIRGFRVASRLAFASSPSSVGATIRLARAVSEMVSAL